MKMLNWYAFHKELVWVLAFVLPVLFCLVHYMLVGPHRTEKSENSTFDLVRRFNGREKFFHWLGLVVFLVMAVTGAAQIFGDEGPSTVGPFHGNLGVLLVIIAIVFIVIWRRYAVFRGYDWRWLDSMGGYLSRESTSLPAGRFNAGQKIYFWLITIVIIALMVTAILMEQGGRGPHSVIDRLAIYWSLHGLIGCFGTAMVIGHAYLSLIANPQTARVLWDGKVSKEYVKKYHSKWDFTG